MATPRTITALSRWSVSSKQLPAIDKIKAIHIYDFDNTLFNSPLPNAKIWNGPTLGLLQNENTFANGGWWHDNRILAATGDGIEKEEPRGWEGWWNEKVLQLVQLSMQQKDVLTILLTGRRDDRFANLVTRMVVSKNLDFDMIVLKPNPGPNGERFGSTMTFKQAYITNLMETYKGAEEIRIYEDRVRHVKGFREFLTEYNKRQNGLGGAPTRSPILAEVVQVADAATLLDPVSETFVLHQIINDHNLAVRQGTFKHPPYQIKKTVFYTGYLISNADTQKLLTLPQIPSNMPDAELKFLANNVLITPRPCPASILDKVGGMGTKLIWEVTGTGVFENKIWAAAVRPVPSTAKYYTDNPSPIVVLALRKFARPIDAGKIQNWQPVPADKQFRFETTVGEKMLLRVEDGDLKQDEYESLFPNKGKRKHSDEDLNSDSRQKNGNSSYDSHQGVQQSGRGSYQQQNSSGRNNENRNSRGGWHRGNNNNGSGGAGRGRTRSGNGGNGRGGRNRGGGGGYNYKSLDDMGGSSGGGGYGDRAQVGYADYDPRVGQYGGPNQQGQQSNYQQAPQNGYGNYQQHGGPPGSGQGGGLNQYY